MRGGGDVGGGPLRRGDIGLALGAVVGIAVTARSDRVVVAVPGGGAAGGHPPLRRSVGLALGAVVGIARRARSDRRVVAVLRRRAAGALPAGRRGVGGAAGAVGGVARRARLDHRRGHGAGAVLPPALLTRDRVEAAHPLAVLLHLGARPGSARGAQRVGRRARIVQRRRVVERLGPITALGWHGEIGLPVTARRRVQRHPARMRHPMIARRGHIGALAAPPVKAALLVIVLLDLTTTVAIRLPSRARRRVQRHPARMRHPMIARRGHIGALAALPDIAALLEKRVVPITALAALGEIDQPATARRRVQRDPARVRHPVIARRRLIGALAALPVIAALLVIRVVPIAALAVLGEIDQPATARRRVQRDPARVGHPVIARGRHRRAHLARPRGRLMLDRLGRGGGLAFAFVEHLVAGAVRRYGLLAAMRLAQLVDAADQHVAVGGLWADMCDRHGLDLGRLAQPVVEHHAIGAAQTRRPRRCGAGFCGEAVPPHAELFGAVAVAVGALNPRHRPHARDHRGGDQRRCDQPRRPAQPTDAPRPVRAAERAISTTPPPPPLGRTGSGGGS